MGFNVGLSGLQAASQRLNVIGNNIANASTVGFKSSRAEFADIYSSNGGTSSTNIGNGVRLSMVRQSFKAGILNPTDSMLDLGIAGSGFFMMNDQGAKVFTRAGQFQVDKDHYIVNASNQRLTGLLADPDGKITASSGDLKINTANITPRATTLSTAGVNLFSKSVPPSVDWSGSANPASDTFNNVSSTTIYDSLGNSHVLSTYYIAANSDGAPGTPNAGAKNQWYVAFQIDNQDVPAITNPPPATTNVANLHAVTFNSDGSFSSINGPGGAPLVGNKIPLNINLNNGADSLNFDVDLSQSTQFGSPYSVNSINSNGYTTGNYNGLNIDDSGIISVIYTNGQTLSMGQIQLANFADPNGLQSLGNTSWAQTVTSGQPLVSTPGSGSLGGIKAGTLEDSNVDLTGELVSLISAQQAFQANAKTISTEDQTIQAIFNIR